MIHKLTSLVRRCIDDYNMIEQGETLAVGVSGGKDSIALLCTLAQLRNFHPKNFSLHAITLTMGFDDMDISPIAALCEKINVPFTHKETDIGRIIFDERKEQNPCSLCAKMRRGVLSDTVLELGARKVALAHHFDDAVETFLLSLLFEGRVHCFQPSTHLDRTDTVQIRPMLYVKEETIVAFIESEGLQVVENTCPMNGYSKREEVKTLLKTLGEYYPDVKQKIFGAMQRLPVKGWEIR